MRFLAVDFGEKRTGLAVCDEKETMAFPLTVLEGQGGLANRIAKIAKEEQAQGFVMGLPLNMDGTEGDRAARVRHFTEKLSQVTDLPVFFHDERLSSFEAENKLAGHLTRKKKKKHLDAVAAAGILESFLQKRREMPED
ncbi:Putative Holliday junction resolvase [Anaerohalosphaera lusitana]|uniref:Putative pre-16S rRNA nuclease n=1 Tax=Anaerohalosphaera lusitana TaxID=1936003 RepID=A0A1U9NLQ3_9BACT|nr:Holliday junction resolvase RuvX [Anaerohalosphaera lusitana]AQT68863.1 Putative Holliday junction resolvase [Anaerohalosphaera lusitana]